MPPDWAIAEAIKRTSAAHSVGNPWTVKEAKASKHAWAEMTRLAASLIAEHEQPPVDPLVKALRTFSRTPGSAVACDEIRRAEVLRDALSKHGLEIREVRP